MFVSNHALYCALAPEINSCTFWMPSCHYENLFNITPILSVYKTLGATQEIVT